MKYYTIIDNSGGSLMKWTIEKPATKVEIKRSLFKIHAMLGKDLSWRDKQNLPAFTKPTLSDLLRAYNLDMILVERR